MFVYRASLTQSLSDVNSETATNDVPTRATLDDQREIPEPGGKETGAKPASGVHRLRYTLRRESAVVATEVSWHMPPFEAAETRPKKGDSKGGEDRLCTVPFQTT